MHMVRRHLDVHYVAARDMTLLSRGGSGSQVYALEPADENTDKEDSKDNRECSLREAVAESMRTHKG